MFFSNLFSNFFNFGLYVELLSAIRERKEAGRISPNVASGMEELYQNYKNAVNYQSYG